MNIYNIVFIFCYNSVVKTIFFLGHLLMGCRQEFYFRAVNGAWLEFINEILGRREKKKKRLMGSLMLKIEIKSL